ncbi:hypothetical protein B0T24DRAFT_529089 [Lasiosphaeria ovina]|uniref:Galactose oxidase n=1 Tax=Lasiosphaeria ovina TaxID=92902 RepID=A0AAE0KBL4_9PEZI|nr:hypothetical protein B0T24DRAFT_529089 [Lasiosphaeria ovina]
MTHISAISKVALTTVLLFALLYLVTFHLLIPFYLGAGPLFAKASPSPHEQERLGRWGPSIPLPLVPVAIAVLPVSGKVLVWSADKARVFSNSTGHTLTAIFDPATSTVEAHNVTQTHHNMFCPGLSLDFSGRPVVTGGSSPTSTSIYDPVTESWVIGPALTTGRGYHSQATLSDGRIFTIGGSWSGVASAPKNGEILSFSPSSSGWAPLPSALALPMHTSDQLGIFAADNHGWLFAWTNNTVFQAGPSRNMNWYAPDDPTTGRSGMGAHLSAGARADSRDAMNGNAIMFSASPVTGALILTLGGAESYSLSPETSAAHLISLPPGGATFSTPTVSRLEDMHHPGAYSNSVVLPTGDVFIVGGASYAKQWSDVNVTLVPELFSAGTHTFAPLARMAVARTYHSVAVLLPDATVLVGGGGLCWELCDGDEKEINHLDLQVYEPGYLFGGDGLRVEHRPRIVEISNTRLAPGEDLVVVADGHVREFAIVRYGSATHATNTDQRRIRLDATAAPVDVVAAQEGVKERQVYEVQVPHDAGIAVPGYWMLFAMSSVGVLSVAETIFIRLA